MKNSTTSTTPLRLAALGSSFAAGPGIPPQVNRAAARSGNNYAHLLAARPGARLTDLTVSGATLNNILSEPQVCGSTTFPPQLQDLPADADIVTVTGGGNDLQYIGSMITEAVKGTLLGYILSWLKPAVPPSTLTAQDVADRFIAVVDGIRQTAPKARIVLVEYFTMLSEDTKPGIDVRFTAEQIQHFIAVAEELNLAYRLTVEARPFCTVIPVYQRSQNHALGSKESWVEGCSWKTFWQGNPFHPNRKGMQAVADMIFETLEGSAVKSSKGEI